MERVIIFGASRYGEVAFNVLKDKYEIIGFSDNNQGKWGTEFCNRNIIQPDMLKEYTNSTVVIASQYYAEIARQLQVLGLKSIYIFFYSRMGEQSYTAPYKLIRPIKVNKYLKITLDDMKIEDIKRDFLTNYSGKENNSYKKIDLKNSTKRKVLIVAYIFPPIGGGGVQRTLKFAKYLRGLGWEPIVLTVGEKFELFAPEDNSLLGEIPDDMNIIRINHRLFNSEELNQEEIQQLVNLYSGIVQSKELMQVYLEHIKANNAEKRGEILLPDINAGWVNDVLKHIEQIIELRDIDVVYTTGMPFSDHFIGYYIKLKYNIPWVADFRDHWTIKAKDDVDNYAQAFFVNREIVYKIADEMEKNIVEKADKITTITPTHKEDFIEVFKLPQDKVKMITNGYDEEDFKDIFLQNKDNKKFTICYNGEVYLNRNPIILIQIINRLIEAKQIQKDRIQVVFNGIIRQPTKDRLLEADKYEIVILNGYRCHKESLAISMQANLLLLIPGGTRCKYAYTGKVFEYLRMRIPILCFSPKGSILEELLIRTEAGVSIEYDEETEIKKYVKKMYEKWTKGENEFRSNTIEVEKYERKYLTKQLSKVFDSIVK